MKRWTMAVIAAIAAVLSGTTAGAGDNGAVLAYVNGDTITMSDVEKAFGNTRATTDSRKRILYNNVLENLINCRLALQEMARDNVAIDREAEPLASVERHFRDEASRIVGDDAHRKAFYDRNRIYMSPVGTYLFFLVYADREIAGKAAARARDGKVCDLPVDGRFQGLGGNPEAGIVLVSGGHFTERKQVRSLADAKLPKAVLDEVDRQADGTVVGPLETGGRFGIYCRKDMGRDEPVKYEDFVAMLDSLKQGGNVAVGQAISSIVLNRLRGEGKVVMQEGPNPYSMK